MNRRTSPIRQLLACTALLAALSTQSFATLTHDECTSGSGCIATSNGGAATFNFTASFDADTHSYDGRLSFADTNAPGGGITLSSTTLLDYSAEGNTIRGFIFDLSGSGYSQARVFIVDNGDSGDTAQIQLLDTSGVPIYDTLPQTLNTNCAGGIRVGDCSVPSPCQLEITASCTKPLPPPPTNCTAKVTKLVMNYTRGDCSSSSNSQTAGLTSCTGTTGTLPSLVYIVASDSSSVTDTKAKIYFKGYVSGGQNYTIDSRSCSATEIKTNLYIHIISCTTAKEVQTVLINTSCTQPLVAGNQFGASKVVSVTTNGGSTTTTPPPNPQPAGECTISGSSGSMDFYYTIKNGGATAIPVSSLTLTDSFGPIDLSSFSNTVLQAGQSITLTITENVTGPFPFVNTVTVNGGAGQCTDMDTVTIKQQTAPPEVHCDDFVTGGGWILTSQGCKANFGVHGGIKNGKFWGGLNYIDHGSGMHVKSKATTGYTVVSENCRRITYTVTINGQNGTATVTVCDLGEPGRNDAFQIELSNGYKAGGDLGGSRKGGGNIQLHKKHCKDGKPEKDDNCHMGNGGGNNSGGGSGGGSNSGGNNGGHEKCPKCGKEHNGGSCDQGSGGGNNSGGNNNGGNNSGGNNGGNNGNNGGNTKCSKCGGNHQSNSCPNDDKKKASDKKK